MMWNIAVNELRRQLQMISILVVTFIVPLLLIFLLGSSLSGSGKFKAESRDPAPFKAGIVQQDQGVLAQAFAQFLTADDVRQWIEPIAYADREEVIRLIRDGKLGFGLVIPSTFSDDVLNGRQATWEMIMGNDYANNLAAKSVFGAYLDIVNTQQALALTAEHTGSSAAKNGIPPAAGTIMQGSAGEQENEAAIVEVNPMQDQRNPTAMQYYSVSILVMYMLYTGMSLAISILADRQNYTFHRIMAAPVRTYSYMSGKLIGQSIIAVCQAIFMIALSHWLFGVDWGRDIGALVIVCLLLIVSSMALGSVIIAYVREEKSIKGLFQFLVITMTAISGGFFPISEVQATVGPFTLSHWAMQSMLRFMMNGGWSDTLHYMLPLAGIAGVLFLLAVWSFRKVVNYA